MVQKDRLGIQQSLWGAHGLHRTSLAVVGPQHATQPIRSRSYYSGHQSAIRHRRPIPPIQTPGVATTETLEQQTALQQTS